MGSGPGSHGKELIMAFDYMHPPEDFEYLGEWCKAWRDPATGDWTISQLLDGLETEQIILSGEEVRELARLAAQHDPTDYELEYGELRRPMFASPAENGTAVNAAEGAGGEQARIHSAEALHRDTGITDPERPFKHECSCGRWFTALDWHLHGCWTGSECQYDEPPSILHEYERFLAYDLLCEALGQVGVLAPIRYKHPSRMGRGRGKSCVVSCVSSGRAVC